MLDDAIYDRWRLTRGEEYVEIAVNGDRVAADSEIVRRWAVAGLGICYRAHIDVHADLASGRLRLVCPDWQGENVPLTMVLAHRKHVSPAVNALREFLASRFQSVLRS
jgi:DNA-binding transcriptional LysR family regulator